MYVLYLYTCNILCTRDLKLMSGTIFTKVFVVKKIENYKIMEKIALNLGLSSTLADTVIDPNTKQVKLLFTKCYILFPYNTKYTIFPAKIRFSEKMKNITKQSTSTHKQVFLTT